MGNSASKLKETIESLSATSDLDENGKKILNLLKKNGKSIMKKAPEVLTEMVKKAHRLIGSPFYNDIIQKMVEKYQATGRRPLDDPLLCLVKQMENMSKQRALFEHQEKLLPLIQILQKAGDPSQTRTRCLYALLLNAQYGRRWREGRLQWREDLMATVGLLMEKGADPTWVPQDCYEGSALYNFLQRENEGSALYNFFQRILLILAHDTHLYDALLSLLPRFLTEQCLNHREPRGPVSVLHALVDYDWKRLPEDLPGDFSEQYKGIICTVVEANPALLDMTDSDRRNLLQCFMSGITKHKDLFRIVNDIVPTLKTENNVNTQDKVGQTVLHILAGKCSEVGREAFLELIKCLRSSSNVDVQNKDGQTVLHILAGNCSQIGHEAFLELVKCLRSSSSVDIQDKDGQTVLHLLAKGVYDKPDLGQNLLSIFPHLTTEQNVNSVDCARATPYSWILAGLALQTNSQDVFSQIEAVFVTKGADAECARPGVQNLKLEKSISILKEGKDLDHHGREILQLLAEYERNALDPQIFLGMVGKAHCLIGSRFYLEIIQKMAEIYQTIERRPQKGPLQCLVEQMAERGKMWALFEHQKKLLPLIQVILSH